MPKNADLKNRVRKIMARDGSTYQVALRVARAYPYDLGFPNFDEATKAWLPEGAGRYGFLTFAQHVDRLTRKVTDETGADVSASGNLILVTGDCSPLPAEVIDWAAAAGAVVFEPGQAAEAIESARRGNLTVIAAPVAGDRRNSRAFTAIRRFADDKVADRSELDGVLRGCVDVHRMTSGRLLLSAARFARYRNRRHAWKPEYDAGLCVGTAFNAELMIRLGLATAEEILATGYQFTNQQTAYFHEVEEHFGGAPRTISA